MEMVQITHIFIPHLIVNHISIILLSSEHYQLPIILQLSFNMPYSISTLIEHAEVQSTPNHMWKHLLYITSYQQEISNVFKHTNFDPSIDIEQQLFILYEKLLSTAHDSSSLIHKSSTFSKWQKRYHEYLLKNILSREFNNWKKNNNFIRDSECTIYVIFLLVNIFAKLSIKA